MDVFGNVPEPTPVDWCWHLTSILSAAERLRSPTLLSDTIEYILCALYYAEYKLLARNRPYDLPFCDNINHLLVDVDRHSWQGQTGREQWLRYGVLGLLSNHSGWIQNGKCYFIIESASFRRVCNTWPKYSGGQLRLRVLVQGSYERLRSDSRSQRRRPDMEELRDRAPGTSQTADEWHESPAWAQQQTRQWCGEITDKTGDSYYR